MRTKQRTIKYPDLQLPCPICGKILKTRQALSGHTRLKHDSSAERPAEVVSAIASPGGSAGPSVTELRELKAEVERLELELKRRKLQAEFPASEPQPADLMQQLGLGPFDPGVRAEVQRRAVNATEQPAKTGPDWVALLNSPNLPIILQALKGALGVNRDGDQTAGLLRDLGFNLKDLLLEKAAPKAAGLTVGGVSFDGASLTPSLLATIMEYKAVEEKAKGDFEGRKAMADALQDAVKALAPALGDLVQGRQGAGPGITGRDSPGRQEPSPERFAIKCDKCGHENEIPDSTQPGAEIKCQGVDKSGNPCEESWIATDLAQERKQERKAKKAKKVEVEEPAKSLACECGQLLNIEGLPLGSELTCPICQKVLVISSPDIAMNPGPVEKEEKKTDPSSEGHTWRGG